jgi:extracellular factor (EF) 3-hydroxypalmitic acid methyl ester biosynthesis protein
MDSVAIKESLAKFRTSEGLEVRATLLRFTRHVAFLEIHNPNNILKTSEVLSQFKIIWNDRALYSGRAVVRSLVNTGLATICEVTLDDGWADVDLSAAIKGDSLSGQFKEFMAEWQKLYRVMPDYKVVLADLQSFLCDLRLWLEQVELGTRALPAHDRIRLEHDIVHQLTPSVVPSIAHLFERYEEVAERVDPELVPTHHVFGKRQLHPLLLSSPFVHRTYAKPLGYAGDYEMVNMMFREPSEGRSIFSKMVNVYALQLPPIIAHRNRIDYLTEQLVAEACRLATRGRPLRVLNLGCGPAQEIQRFLAQQELSHRAAFTLIDFNDETLAYSGNLLNEIKRRHWRATTIEMTKKSVHQILKHADRAAHITEPERFDLVYCAGLFDYLSDKVCRRLLEIFYEQLSPDGLLIATNVAANPARNEMECFLEWHVIHRTVQQMRALVPTRASRENVTLKHDPTGVNVFLEIRNATGER